MVGHAIEHGGGRLGVSEEQKIQERVHRVFSF
jgi:hypothetical protein